MRVMRRLVIVFTLLIITASIASGVSAQSGTIIHHVARGDNLFRIAQRYGVSVQYITSVNGIWDANRIYVGQAIVIPLSGYPTPPVYPAPPVYPTPTPPPPAPTPVIRYYTVQAGDTLSGIARAYHSTPAAIASANGIANWNYIYRGQTLAIPYVPQIYTYYVQRGDTLAKIAAHYGTTVSAISSYNGLINPNLVYPGQRLYIPV